MNIRTLLAPLAPVASLFRGLRKRVRARPDTEIQQGLIRLAIVLGFYLYFSLGGLAHSAAMDGQVHFLGLTFTMISLTLLVGALLDPEVSVLRRGIGMLHDFTVATYMLAISNETGAPVVATYLWVTLGNGFRYGMPYLLLSTLASAVGFVIVFHYNPFWQSHAPLWWGMWITLIVVPLYAATLLRQLHGAIRREQVASQAKSSFLANMSHELRTPLNGVIGATSLLAETRLGREQQEFTHIIRASANTLLELIDNVLDISRIETGRLATTAEDFDLHRLMNGIVSMMEAQAQGKGLVLAAHIAPQTPFRLHGDARHLRQVLINLIGNAIKFTELGRVDVYVRPVGQGQPQRLRFEIVDTGIGIPEAAQARIFDSFSQADPSITRRFGGTGLGTTIARQLVESLGGEIGLKSRVGEGTTFWFELPFTLRTNPAAPPAPHFDAPLGVAILASGELSLRLRSMIRDWDAEPVVVENATRLAAELGSRAAAGTPLGAVIVERCMLPGDPATFLHLLHDDPDMAGLPVILIESDAIVPGLHDGELMRQGYASVLRTPVNATLLFNAIHAATSHEMPDNVVSLADRFPLPKAGAEPLRILVAEDNPINQRVIRGLLEHAGHQTFLAHDGEEALAMLESGGQTYDLAIIDMHMPMVSGPEVVRHWRFMESGHLPMIMLTADARPDAKAACEEAGADAFLTKPVNSHALIDAIAALTRHAAPRTGPENVRDDTATLDESVLDGLAHMVGPAFVHDLLANFADESERLMHSVTAALDAQDYAAWHDHLHKLKGGAHDLGANLLAQRCAEAERIKPYELAGAEAQQKLDAVRTALSETGAALTGYLRRTSRAERI